MSDKKESTVKALWNSIKRTANHFNEQTAPKPNDSLPVKALKVLGRIVGIILSIALSPLVLLALFLAFVAAL